jgi:GNAT superfamily N-acetyltransferase
MLPPNEPRGDAGLFLRRASAVDAAALATLLGELGYPSTEAEARQRVEQLSGRGDHAVYVAVIDGAVVGWIHVFVLPSMEHPPRAVIAGLVVSELYRGRGIGERLVIEAEEWSLLHGCHHVRLRSNVVRKEAHRFYERLGYSVTKTSLTFDKVL